MLANIWSEAPILDLSLVTFGQNIDTFCGLLGPEQKCTDLVVDLQKMEFKMLLVLTCKISFDTAEKEPANVLLSCFLIPRSLNLTLKYFNLSIHIV